MVDSASELGVKVEKLLTLLQGFESCAVAFSGGLDSGVLAKAACLALGGNAVTITCVSSSMASGELDQCRTLAEQIGIRHESIETDELSNVDYQRNTADRCYHCKLELLSKLKIRADELGMAVVVEGANVDDDREHRPGRRAVAELGVRCPLAECGFTKVELRWLAADWGLSVWDKPATPCLSSRIAYGEKVTPERLAMVDRAEIFLRERGFEPLRVRYHKGGVARIEVPKDRLSRFFDTEFREAVVKHFRELGFKYVTVDLEGFRSGSLNDVLVTEDLELRDDR